LNVKARAPAKLTAETPLPGELLSETEAALSRHTELRLYLLRKINYPLISIPCVEFHVHDLKYGVIEFITRVHLRDLSVSVR